MTCKSGSRHLTSRWNNDASVAHSVSANSDQITRGKGNPMSAQSPPTASSWPPNGSPTPAPKDTGPDRPSRPAPGPRGHIGWIVAGSLATGLVAALLLVAAPFIPAEENAVTGAVLCGFALGWAMLAVLSVRFTDQPQRWATAPALLMGVGGLLLVAFGSSVQAVLN
jgi:hypothetical protein